MKMIDYELTCSISYLFEKKIFIYGTGIYGNKVAEVLLQMKIAIEGFCETNPKKNKFLEMKVLSVENLIENYNKNDVLVIVASEKYYKEMIRRFETVEGIILCTYYALFVSLYLNYETEGTRESLKNNIKLFKKVSLDRSIKNFMKLGAEWYCNILLQPSFIWLYQPGKVASKTIYHSTLLRTHHLHSLASAFITDSGISDICNSIIDKVKKNPIKIITGVREPISRDISLFFEGTEYNIWPFIYYGNCSNYLFGDYSKNNKLDIQELRKRICIFEKNLNYSFEHLGRVIAENRSDEFSWFDYEIKALLDVDIYKYPFDKEKGYAIIEQDNICILVYKCEKLNQLENVIGEFLEDAEFTLKNANQGEEKIYSYVYKRFKKEVKLNKEYFDYYYADNPKLKHFYTDAEIEQFKQKWKKRLQ